MSRRGCAVLAISASLLAEPALCGPAEATACATHLSPAGQAMFNAVVPHMKAGSDLATVMREQVMRLVLTGRIRGAEATENSKPAAKCVMLLQATH